MLTNKPTMLEVVKELSCSKLTKKPINVSLTLIFKLHEVHAHFESPSPFKLNYLLEYHNLESKNSSDIHCDSMVTVVTVVKEET